MADQNINLREYAQEQIRIRYSQDSILEYGDNRLLHRMLQASPMSAQELAGFGPIMNPNLPLMHTQALEAIVGEGGNQCLTSLENPITQRLLDELNIRPTADDFKKLRERNIKLAVIGLGGAMLNMLHNMYNFAMAAREPAIFEKIAVFEKDSINFTNLPRFGKLVTLSYHSDFSADFDGQKPELRVLSKLHHLLTNEGELSKERKFLLMEEWLTPEMASTLDEKGYTLVGAPTIETRRFLTDKEFFFVGHGDYEVDIVFQPHNPSTLAVETYGVIDIPAFLINMQLVTAAFIKALANGDNKSSNEILFRFDLKKYLEENR